MSKRKRFQIFSVFLFFFFFTQNSCQKRRHFVRFLRDLSLTQSGSQSQGLADSCNSSSNDCGTVCMPPVSVLPTGRDTVQLCTSPTGAQTRNKLSRNTEIHSIISNSEAFMYLNTKPTINKCTRQTHNKLKNIYSEHSSFL